jgi:hypothetical protein
VLHLLIWTRPVRLKELATSAVPMATVGVVFVAMRYLSPEMFAAVVSVPASIRVYPERAPGLLLYLLGTFPIFFVALLSMTRRALTDVDRWILSAILVLLPASVWTVCKSGGSYNSFLPAYLAMTALFVARLQSILDWAQSISARLRWGAVAAVAMAILLSFLLQIDRVNALLFARHGDEQYGAAVRLARDLAGLLVSPQDPTIAYRATGYVGSALFFELDKHAVNGNWPETLPVSCARELGAAKYVVQVRSYVPTPVFERALLEQGFAPMPVVALRNSAYTLWAKQSD